MTTLETEAEDNLIVADAAADGADIAFEGDDDDADADEVDGEESDAEDLDGDDVVEDDEVAA